MSHLEELIIQAVKDSVKDRDQGSQLMAVSAQREVIASYRSSFEGEELEEKLRELLRQYRQQ